MWFLLWKGQDHLPSSVSIIHLSLCFSDDMVLHGWYRRWNEGWRTHMASFNRFNWSLDLGFHWVYLYPKGTRWLFQKWLELVWYDWNGKLFYFLWNEGFKCNLRANRFRNLLESSHYFYNDHEINFYIRIYDSMGSLVTLIETCVGDIIPFFAYLMIWVVVFVLLYNQAGVGAPDRKFEDPLFTRSLFVW